MLRKPLFALAMAFAVVTSASPAPAQAKERTKAELKALKKVMKGWSKSLGVKCKLCHNPKDFKEWTAQREVGMAMSELFVDVLKPATDKPGGECAACHTKSLKPDDAKMAAFGKDKLKALAPRFKERAGKVKAPEAKDKLLSVAKYLEGL